MISSISGPHIKEEFCSLKIVITLHKDAKPLTEAKIKEIKRQAKNLVGKKIKNFEANLEVHTGRQELNP